MSNADTDPQLWSVAIGLAKLQGDQTQIDRRFVAAFNTLHKVGSAIESKMTAAEIMTALNPSQWAENTDLQALAKTLSDLESQAEAQGPRPEGAVGRHRRRHHVRKRLLRQIPDR